MNDALKYGFGPFPGFYFDVEGYPKIGAHFHDGVIFIGLYKRTWRCVGYANGYFRGKCPGSIVNLIEFYITESEYIKPILSFDSEANWPPKLILDTLFAWRNELKRESRSTRNATLGTLSI